MGLLSGSDGVIVDPNTEKSIADFNTQANAPRQVSKFDATLPSQTIKASEKSLYGNEPGMQQAITKKYESVLGRDMKKLTANAQLQSFKDKSNQQVANQGIQQARRRIDIQNKERQMQARMANEQARSGMLASVLGLVGTVAGAVIGGPGGAMVGGAAGNAAGNGLANMDSSNTTGGSTSSNMA